MSKPFHFTICIASRVCGASFRLLGGLVATRLDGGYLIFCMITIRIQCSLLPLSSYAVGSVETRQMLKNSIQEL
jgi:hypothetical protein